MRRMNLFRVPDIALVLVREAGRFISPCLCAACHNSVERAGLCGSCWRGLTLITDDSCRQCGVRFEYKTLLERCGNCIKSPPHYDATVAAAVYSGVMREMTIAFKHGDRQDIAPVLAHIMAPRVMPLLKEADFVVPLPLHRRRFFKRRFNQAAELVRHLLAIGGLPLNKMNTHILLRHKATPSQGRRSRSQRIQAVRGAFSVPEDQIEVIKGKHILIIDDVMTTGASADSAARALKRKGARRVSVAVAARVC